MRNNGVKGFFDRAFCCGKTANFEASTTEPAGVYTITKTETQTSITSVQTTEETKITKKRDRIRRHSAISFKSCDSSIGSFRSLSCSSLQSVMSRNTGNYDYFSVYSNTSGRASFNSCSS